jgi:SAM-dependent methyltransferase
MPESIDWCRRRITPRHPRFRFQVADVHNPRYNPSGTQDPLGFRFPYRDDEFGLAFAASVFTHLRPDETERYLHESARVLRSGGRLVATFFLLNDDTRALLERSPGGALGARWHPHAWLRARADEESGARYWTSSPNLPERRIGLEEGDVLAMNARAGLEVAEVRHGTWPGREPSADRLGQDLVVARLP